MTGTIFDLVEQQPSEGTKGFFEIAAKAPSPKDNSYFNSVKEYSKSIGKGVLKGIVKLGESISPADPYVPRGEFSKQLNEYAPTDEAPFAARALERGLEEAPTMMAMPGGGVVQSGIRSILAGFAGEGAKELGGPEWAQSAAEITMFLGPDITKKLLQKGSQAELITAAKRMGMTDTQITPILQSEFKQKWLAKLTPRTGSTQAALKDTKEGIGKVYEHIRQYPAAQKNISAKAEIKLKKDFQELLMDMPSKVRGSIKKDLQDLVSKPITGDSLINFYQDVGHSTTSRAKQLSRLKNPIRDALSSINPSMGKDFNTANEMYSKYSKIAGRLKPTLVSEIVRAGEALGLIGSLVTGHTPSMMAIAGEKGLKILSQQLLLNPHFQQLSSKMVSALNANKASLAYKISQDMMKEIDKYSPEMANKLKELSEDEFEQFFKRL